MKYEVKEKTTLLNILALMYPDSSKTTLRNFLKLGCVSVNGTPVKIGSTLIEAGHFVNSTSKSRAIKDRVPIIYQDTHLVIVNKPAGLLSVASNDEQEQTLHEILKKHFFRQKIYIVHRLDRDTSGLIMFAKTLKAQSALKKLLETHDIQRQYLAITEGQIKEARGTWTSKLIENKQYKVHTTQSELGKSATTHFEVIQSSKKFTCLKIRLETGRKNQIRVHCQDAGHPIVGDKKYGSKHNPLRALGLQAYQLHFRHPMTGQDLSFKIPAPNTFQKILKTDTI